MTTQQKNNAFSFSFRVWFLTLLLGALLYFVLTLIIFDFGISINSLSLVSGVVIMLVLSIPFFLIFLIFNNFIFRTIENKIHTKLTINLFVLFSFFNLSWLLSFEAQSVIFLACMLVVSSLLIWKIKIINESEIHLNEILDDDKGLDF
ncbi:MAG: hypothetical protein AB8H03_18865 [Saprospiraceae bacterium]